MKDFSLIVATDSEWGIGKDESLPWSLPQELKHFANVTTQNSKSDRQNTVIMGRVTWESIPENHRPLKDRKNIVLTRDPEYAVPADVGCYASLDEALEASDSESEIFVIGGSRVYHEAIQREECKKIYLTRINKDFDCDAFFPKIYDEDFDLAEESDPINENGIDYKYLIYTRRVA